MALDKRIVLGFFSRANFLCEKLEIRMKKQKNVAEIIWTNKQIDRRQLQIRKNHVQLTPQPDTNEEKKQLH